MSAAVKLGYRPKEAFEMFGSRQLVEDCVREKWLKPTVQRNGLTIYDAGDLARCWERIRSGDMPAARKRTKK